VKLGPTTIFECQKCDNLLSIESLYTSNTFDAELFSDGKLIAICKPEFPKITKCSKCNEIFWIDKANKVGKYKFGDKIDERWAKAEKARFLNIYEYNQALKCNIYFSDYKELFFRQRILWGFNDRVRSGEPMFINDSDMSLYHDNMHKLLEILECKDLNKKILAAELNRNLGNFEKCMEILAGINDPKIAWLISAFDKECNLKNTKVFKFPDSH
jgi:hypothetical protein